MKNTLLYILTFLLGTTLFYGQKKLYKTDIANIKFDAGKNKIEPINAENEKVKIILNSDTGEIACSMNMSDFSFPNKLMQEHFNENYIESDKYPKATFTGKIDNFSKTDLSSEKTVWVKGTFKIHGNTQTKTTKIKLLKQNNNYVIKSTFILELKDYKIKIPSIMFYKIAEKVNVNLTAELKEL